MLAMLKSGINRYWGVLLILLLWQAWVTIGQLNAIVLPQPVNVLVDLVIDPRIHTANGIQTLALAIAGLLLGMTFDSLLAILCWFSRLATGMLVPLAMIFSSAPIVALIPIIARLLGYDIKTVLAIVVIVSFFPAFVFTSSGMRALPPGAPDLFEVLGASRRMRFRHLVLPAAVPNWMIALRLAVSSAVLSAMLAEYFMGQSGLGYLFRQAAGDFDMERAFGTSVIATVVSVVTFTLSQRAERAVNTRWR
ncbi:NitT/TauT family transport system permease protein [Neorhizobium alkalisoli]|uniref:NitT/TauT family transport system permease protein n=2 Tax=Neorhizobium alkalisoli TaxID=528178 RepID=A0A561QAL9_9HYPH|nr:NitT/TauT family transport system permease protein [Neorhizobium alkalisoli]